MIFLDQKIRKEDERDCVEQDTVINSDESYADPHSHYLQAGKELL